MAGKVILVTGASSGIGALCAAQLAADGHQVLAASRRASAPAGCTGLAMDVDRDESVQNAVASLLQQAGRIDAALLCAGWGLAGAIEDCTSDDAKAQFETNFFGVHRVCRALLPAMRAQGSGRILIVSSLVAQIPVPFQAMYGASKAALSSYAEALRMETAAFGIRVSCIEPGNFRTGFTGSRRRAEAWTDDSPYAANCQASIDWMERDERNAPEPHAVVREVRRLLDGGRMPMRSVVAANAFERAGPMLRALLPAALYEPIARRVFRID